jgi:hypothetical protein
MMGLAARIHCNGNLVKWNYYEDGRYQAESILSYTDTTIVEKDRLFDYLDKSNPYSYYQKIWIYLRDKKTGKFYCSLLKADFKLPNEID